LLRSEGIGESRRGTEAALVGTRAQEEGADGPAGGRGARPAGPARTATQRVAWADFNTPRCACGLGKAWTRTPRVAGRHAAQRTRSGAPGALDGATVRHGVKPISFSPIGKRISPKV
jgi:hypothetical protein